MSAACTAAPADEQVSLTAAQAGLWVLRNLVLLMGAFFPSMLLLGTTLNCVGMGPQEDCGAAAIGIVPLLWMWFALPVLVLGGVHVLVVLAIARHAPRLARGVAALTLAAVVAAWLNTGELGGSRYDVPLAGLCILYYAFMLRLDPRQRLEDAMWVWAVPPGLAAFDVALMLARVA